MVWNSADIIKWIDQKVPARRVIPEGLLGLCEIIDQWADNMLFSPILLLVIPDLLDAAGLHRHRREVARVGHLHAEDRRFRHL